MLAVCQPFSTIARYHLSFDALMLRSVCLAFPDEQIPYMADRVNCSHMKQYLQEFPANLRMLEVGLPENGARGLHLRGRLLVNLIRCRRTAERLGARAILYLAFNTETCALHLVQRSQVPEYYIVHNNFHKVRRTLWGRLLFRWIGIRAPYLIFLEQSIANAALSECALDADQVIVIPFPIGESAWGPNDERNVARRGIVMAGVLRKGKGVQTLLDAARILKGENPWVLERLPIRIVGPFFSGANPREYSDCVEYTDRQLTNAELEQVMRSSQFVIVPYEPESYAYVTPDTMYRALGLGRPVVVTDLPSLYPLTRGSRPVGIAFSDRHQLVNTLMRIASMPEQEYDRLCDNVDQLVRQRSVMATARRLRQALEETL